MSTAGFLLFFLQGIKQQKLLFKILSLGYKKYAAFFVCLKYFKSQRLSKNFASKSHINTLPHVLILAGQSYIREIPNPVLFCC